MKKLLTSLTGLIKKHWYFLLLFAAGSLAIGESIRLTNKYKPSHWLSGPSGFVMIVGIGFVILLVFEVLSNIIRARKRVKKEKENVAETVAPVVSIAEETAEAETDVPDAAEQKLYTRNMWLSFGLLIAYTLLIKVLGFALSSAIYLAVNLLLLKNSKKATIITVAAVLLFLLAGAPALSISFPRGIFGF